MSRWECAYRIALEVLLARIGPEGAKLYQTDPLAKAIIEVAARTMAELIVAKDVWPKQGED